RRAGPDQRGEKRERDKEPGTHEPGGRVGWQARGDRRGVRLRLFGRQWLRLIGIGKHMRYRAAGYFLEEHPHLRAFRWIRSWLPVPLRDAGSVTPFAPFLP